MRAVRSTAILTRVATCCRAHLWLRWCRESRELRREVGPRAGGAQASNTGSVCGWSGTAGAQCPRTLRCKLARPLRSTFGVQLEGAPHLRARKPTYVKRICLCVVTHPRALASCAYTVRASRRLLVQTPSPPKEGVCPPAKVRSSSHRGLRVFEGAARALHVLCPRPHLLPVWTRGRPKRASRRTPSAVKHSVTTARDGAGRAAARSG